MAGQSSLHTRLRLLLRKSWRELNPPSVIHNLDDLDGHRRNESTILRAVFNRDAGDVANMRQLGVPVPRVVKPLTIRPQDRLWFIDCPEYDFPPHLLFRARLPLAPGTVPYAAKPEAAVYFFSSDESAVDEAESLLKEKGLLEVARRFPGRWFNRDPYGALKPTGQLRIGVHTPMPDIDVNPMLGVIKEQTPPPLEAVTGYPLAELEAIQGRLDFYAALDTSPHLPSLTSLLRYDERNWRPPDIPDSVLFHLPLSMPVFAPEIVSLKILPSGDAPPALMQSFLTSLRHVQHPLAFELIDDGRTAYLQLSCGADDADLVARQLRLHFTNFVVSEHQGADTAVLPSIAVQQAAPYQPTRTLGDFALDPLGQLFAVLDEMSSDEVTAFQVLFSPLQDAAVVTVLEHLQEQARGRSDPELGTRLRQGAQKLPPWQVAVRLICSNPTTLSKLKFSFLSQYHAGGRPFTFPESNAFLTQRSMEHWVLLSTTELAAFAHFPTSESLV